MSAVKYDIGYDFKKITKAWSDENDSSPDLWLWEVDGVSIIKESYSELTREYSRTIGGPTFLVNVYETEFYHFLVDGIAQFLWIKSFVPDLKMYFINDQPSSIVSHEAIVKDFVRNIISWIKEEGWGGEIVNLASYKKVKFDKVFSLANSNITFLRRELEIESNEIEGDVSNNPGARKVLLPRLKEFLFKKAVEHNRLPEDFNYPKRIFLRPGLTYERLQAWKDQLDYLSENGVILDQELNVQEDPNNALETVKDLNWKHGIVTENFSGIMFEIKNRWISKEDIKLIDDFFEIRNYEFIDSQNMAWIDILNIVMRAEKIAVVAGAAVLNTIVSSEDTQIIYLNFDTNYDFDHISTLKVFFVGKNSPIIYYDKNDVAIKKYEVSRVLGELAKEKGDYL